MGALVVGVVGEDGIGVDAMVVGMVGSGGGMALALVGGGAGMVSVGGGGEAVEEGGEFVGGGAEGFVVALVGDYHAFVVGEIGCGDAGYRLFDVVDAGAEEGGDGDCRCQGDVLRVGLVGPV